MPVRSLVSLAALACLVSLGACQGLPPAITGVTIFPSDAQGTPRGDAVARTRARPPIPVIGLRPGSDPQLSATFLNEPATGEVAVTLARGTQSFVLYTAAVEPSEHFVIAIFLDHEARPALSLVVDESAAAVVESRAPHAMGMDGEPVVNRSAVSASRDGYRVSMRRGAFPLRGFSVDAVGPWRLQPDNVRDAVGVVTIDVEPLR